MSRSFQTSHLELDRRSRPPGHLHWDCRATYCPRNAHSAMDGVGRLENRCMTGFLLEAEPLVLPELVVLLLHLRFVSELQSFDLLPLLFPRLFSVSLGAPQMFWKQKLTYFFGRAAVVRSPLLQCQLLHLVVLSDLVRRNSDVVQWHDLLVVELQELDSVPYLVASHVSASETFCLFGTQTLLDRALVPHARRRVHRQAHGIVEQKLFVNSLQNCDLIFRQSLLVAVSDPRNLNRLLR